MKGILKLVISYIRFHIKKTVRTIMGIAVSVLLFVVCSNVILAGNQVARVIETEQNGAYHARFWDVTKEQGECIGQMEGVKTWKWTQEGDVTYADVVFERPSKDIYGICEETAETSGPVCRLRSMMRCSRLTASGERKTPDLQPMRSVLWCWRLWRSCLPSSCTIFLSSS